MRTDKQYKPIERYVTIRVPKNLCTPYVSVSGERYIEIFTPNNTNTRKKWYSFMINAHQIKKDPKHSDYNIIELINSIKGFEGSWKIATDTPSGRRVLKSTATVYNADEILKIFAMFNVDNPYCISLLRQEKA